MTLEETIKTQISPEKFSIQDIPDEETTFYTIVKGNYHVFISYYHNWWKDDNEEAFCTIYEKDVMALTFGGSIEAVLYAINDKLKLSDK